jgi:hypothetical protein
MTSATTLFSAAELAQASYDKLQAGAANTDFNLGVLTRPRVGMSLTQATAFAKRFPTVVASYDDLPGTGFQATVFKDTSGAVPGNLTLAIRGTEDSGGDFFPTDADILTGGAAYDQIVAMVNWWKRASADPGTSEEPTMVDQFRLAEVSNSQIPEGAVVLRAGVNPDTSYVLDVADQVAAFTVAEGNIIAALAADPDHRVEVVGYSRRSHEQPRPGDRGAVCADREPAQGTGNDALHRASGPPATPSGRGRKTGREGGSNESDRGESVVNPDEPQRQRNSRTADEAVINEALHEGA